MGNLVRNGISYSGAGGDATVPSMTLAEYEAQLDKYKDKLVNIEDGEGGVITAEEVACNDGTSVEDKLGECIKVGNVTPYSGAIPVNADLLGGRITADDVDDIKEDINQINNDLSQLFRYEYGTIANGWSDYISYSEGHIIKFEIEVGTDTWRDGIGVNVDSFQRIFIEDNGVAVRLFNNASENVGYRFRILVSKF